MVSLHTLISPFDVQASRSQWRGRLTPLQLTRALTRGRCLVGFLANGIGVAFSLRRLRGQCYILGGGYHLRLVRMF